MKNGVLSNFTRSHISSDRVRSGYEIISCVHSRQNLESVNVAFCLDVCEKGTENRGWQRGGHDPVSRTNFNKIHASRTVLTKFHESRNST